MTDCKQDYDVIIVGAGPAGGTLAYDLASRDIKVLVLEKKKLPRYKPCGGGITSRAVNLLDFSIEPVTEDTIYYVNASYKLKTKGTKRSQQPLMCTVMRDVFDMFLIQKARDAGADIGQGSCVEAIRNKNGSIEVGANGITYSSRVLVGADGFPSTVARLTGLQYRVHPFAVGIEAEVSVAERILDSWNSTIGLDFGTVAGGYGWVFPKKDHLSIGVCGQITEAKNLKSYFRQYIGWLGFTQSDINHVEAHSISFRTNNRAIQTGRVILLGDAAGLCDPLTGEGIYYAIKSAQIASPVVSGFIKGDFPNLINYEEQVNEFLMPELQLARRVAKVIAVIPRFGVELAMRDRLIWQACNDILSGKKSYLEIKQELQESRIFKTALKVFNRLNKP